MSNSFFQFKQFTIHQQHCAMKVCTDACLLGAYAASVLRNDELNILDIGTGTGLLALMLAQKTPAQIDAVEINEAAASQAAENVAASPWAANVRVIHTDIKTFPPGKKYDLIISNPPFFEDDLRSADQSKNDAKHNSGLTMTKLLKIIQQLLSTAGAATLLLPYARTAFVQATAAKMGFFVSAKIKVRPSPRHDFFRTILVLTQQEADLIEEEIFIHDEQRNYSPRFASLLKDYYLKL